MKIAIVGAEERKWTKKQKEHACDLIDFILTAAEDGHLVLPPFIFVNNNIESSGSKEVHTEVVLNSGHCHRGGVDMWAEDTADEHEVKKEIYPAEVHQWEDGKKCHICGSILNEAWYCPVHGNLMYPNLIKTAKGYRSRNIQIAEACDVLFDLEPAITCPVCKGKKKVFITYPIMCDRCLGKGTVPNRSGATWTKEHAEKLGKETYLVVIR